MLSGGPLTSMPRPRDVARVDRVTQGYVAESARPDVAHGGETREQREPRILGADERLARHGNRQPVVAEPGIHGQVRVRVNQAREYRRIRQLDAHRVGGNLRLRSAASADDLSVFDHERLVREQLAGLHIEHVPGMNSDVPRRLRDPVCPQKKQRNGNHSSADLLSHDFPFPQSV